MIYRPKTMFTGYKIGLGTPDLYVGVPTKYFKAGKIKVEYKSSRKVFEEKNAVTTATFNDRFRQGETYTLAYFMWKHISKDEIKPIVKPLPEEPKAKQEAMWK